VINDKIYDIRVNVEVRDDRTPIANATLMFIPVKYDYFITEYGMRPEDYPKAFPNVNDNRTFLLRPVDGSFDELREEFVVDIKNITGGGEYRIVAVVKDMAGNENTVEIKTPYIRQFENVAKQDNVTVGVFYYAWYNAGAWRGGNLTGDVKAVHKPLLGLYDSKDVLVFDKHVDWATGHGIDCFIFEWVGPEDWTDSNLRSLLQKSQLVKNGDIKFAIMHDSAVRANLGKLKWEGIYINFNDPYNRETFLKDIDYLATHYFNYPNYLRIQQKPVIFIYSSWQFTGDLKTLFDQIRKKHNLYLVGDQVSWRLLDKEFIENTVQFDAIYDYGMCINDKYIMNPENFIKLVEDRYKEFKSIADAHGVKFIPSTMPGFNDDKKPGRLEDYPNIERSKEFFRRFTEMDLKYVDPQSKILLITTFNEWHEDTQIEPARDYKENDPFIYLETLLTALRETDS